MKPWLLTFFALALIIAAIALRSPHLVTADPVEPPDVTASGTSAAETADHEFTLQTGIVDGRMAYVGVGGDVDGAVNPDLVVQAGSTVHVTVLNGDGMSHDLAIPDLSVSTALISLKGTAAEIVFTVGVDQVGIYDYFCTVSGHRQAEMQGRFIVR